MNDKKRKIKVIFECAYDDSNLICLKVAELLLKYEKEEIQAAELQDNWQGVQGISDGKISCHPSRHKKTNRIFDVYTHMITQELKLSEHVELKEETDPQMLKIYNNIK